MKIALAFSVCIALLQLLARAQDNPGFINIDCGTSVSYQDDSLGLTYTADTGFVESGETSFVDSKYFNKLQNQAYLMTLRTFPVGKRNCYTLTPSQGKNNRYLIRASFLYGNYDNKFQSPVFDLHIDVNYWTTVLDISNYTYEEIIYTPTRDFIQVCLVNLGSGSPVISALELRLLDNSTYHTASGAFRLNARENIGSTRTVVRYPQDVYDRIWTSQVFNTTVVTNTTNTDALKTNNSPYKVPIEVLTTAQQMRNTSRALRIFWESSNSTYKWFIFCHFAEIQVLEPGQLRQFSVYYNTDNLVTTVTPEYLKPVTVSTPAFSGVVLNVSIQATSNSTLPPYLNAIEYFIFVDLPNSPTELVDVNAIVDIKNAYNVVKESWQGDPCVPRYFAWTGLGCSEDSIPRITSLNLSSSGLQGGIADALMNLTALVTLDLSSNGLTGKLPEFLAELPNLKLLNLSNNNLNGSIPEGLRTKVAAGALQLSLDGNPNICMSCIPNSNPSPAPSGENKKTIHSQLVTALASAVVFLTVLSV